MMHTGCRWPSTARTTRFGSTGLVCSSRGTVPVQCWVGNRQSPLSGVLNRVRFCSAAASAQIQRHHSAIDQPIYSQQLRTYTTQSASTASTHSTIDSSDKTQQTEEESVAPILDKSRYALPDDIFTANARDLSFAQILELVALKSNAKSNDGAMEKEGDRVVIYRGVLSDSIRKVKKLSIFTCALVSISTPLLIFSDSSIPMIARILITTSVSGFSFATTAILSMYSRYYVTKLLADPTNRNRLTIETLSLLGKPVVTDIYIRRKKEGEGEGGEGKRQGVEVKESKGMMGTFEANGQSYFMDPATNKLLMAWLLDARPMDIDNNNKIIKKTDEEKEKEAGELKDK